MTSEHPELSTALGNLFFIERELKDWDAAVATGERMLAVLEEAEAEASARIRVIMQLADTHAAVGNRSKALKHLEEAKRLQSAGGASTADIDKRIATLS
jgi:hypothetical protein